MPDTDKPVVFLLGDSGEEASNDPRYWQEKNEAEMRERVLASIENPGKATPSMPQMNEQLGTGGTRSEMTGAQAASLADGQAVPVRVVGQSSPEGEDSNPDDELLEKPLDDMTGDELKEHVKALEARGIQVDTSGVKKVGELRERVRQAVANAQDDESGNDEE